MICYTFIFASNNNLYPYNLVIDITTYIHQGDCQANILEPILSFLRFLTATALKRVYIEFKYYANAIHSGLTPPG